MAVEQQFTLLSNPDIFPSVASLATLPGFNPSVIIPGEHSVHPNWQERIITSEGERILSAYYINLATVVSDESPGLSKTDPKNRVWMFDESDPKTLTVATLSGVTLTQDSTLYEVLKYGLNYMRGQYLNINNNPNLNYAIFGVYGFAKEPYLATDLPIHKWRNAEFKCPFELSPLIRLRRRISWEASLKQLKTDLLSVS